MSYVKHPAPWIGAVLFLLTALSDAEDSRRSASSAAMRGVLGTTLSVVNLAAGVVGAAAGVMSGKNKKTTTFVLEYSDGHRGTKP